MTSPIERKPNNDKTIMPKRGEGNQLEWDKKNRLAISNATAMDKHFEPIHQSETTHTHQSGVIGEIKQSEIIGENHD